MQQLPGARFVGLDLAWSSGRTGIASLDEDGVLVELLRCDPGDDVEAAVRGLAGHVEVVAVDAPLVVGNETGQRRAEREIGRIWGAFGASAHATSRASQGAVTRAGRLAAGLGWEVAADARPGPGRTRCIEVYPHPALVGLFELPYRLAYKKGAADARLPGFRELVRLLSGHAALDLEAHHRWREIVDVVGRRPRTADLNRVEDEIDAVVCALLALLWARSPEVLQVYGDGDEGYIVAPVPPLHRAVRPLRGGRSTRRGERAERWVDGRPTGFGGSPHETTWKDAVREAFAGVVLPPGARVSVSMLFRLGEQQVGRAESDLDNLVKTTVDALDGVLGTRTGTAGGRTEADDVRVTRLEASKEASAGRASGVLVLVEEIVES